MMRRKSGPVLPRWMRYHDKAAFVMFALDVSFAFAYLSYIGYVMNDRMMYLPYEKARLWLDLNSYSLLPPFFAVPVGPLLAIQVYQEIELSEGDFYGIVGTMLGLGAISLFDATKTMQIYTSLWTFTSSSDNLRNAMQNGVSGNFYSNYRYKLGVKVGGKLMYLEYEHLRDGYRIETGNDTFAFVALPDNRSVPDGGTWEKPRIADRGIRLWTHLIQKHFKCCGAQSYKEWEEFDGYLYPDEYYDKYRNLYGLYPPSCYCDYKCVKRVRHYELCFKGCEPSNSTASIARLKKTPGCNKFYTEYLNERYLATFVLMLVMAVLYIVTIGVYCVNFAAMRILASYNEEDETRIYSLLKGSTDEAFSAAATNVTT